jgi:uncharacterized protein (UPF0332 family)
MSVELIQIIEKAEDCIDAAEHDLKGDFYEAAVNRSYYAIYNCVMALLYVTNTFPKSHKGAHTKFNELYIQTNIFSTRLSKIISENFNKRQLGDYDFDTTIELDEAEISLVQAKEFFETTQNYLKQKNYY